MAVMIGWMDGWMVGLLPLSVFDGGVDVCPKCLFYTNGAIKPFLCGAKLDGVCPAP